MASNLEITGPKTNEEIDAALQGKDPVEPPAPEKSDRNQKGQFVKGNKGGPGNPHNRRIAQCRKAVQDALSEKDYVEILYAILFKAKAGDLPAARFVFQYGLGLAPSPQDPDRLDLEEWRLVKESNISVEETAAQGVAIPVAEAVKATPRLRAIFLKANLQQVKEKLIARLEASAHPGENAPPRDPSPMANGCNGNGSEPQNGDGVSLGKGPGGANEAR